MINFRVTDLDGFIEQLSASGVKIDKKRDSSSIGKFAWVYDPEGNKIELWEPSDESQWKRRLLDSLKIPLLFETRVF